MFVRAKRDFNVAIWKARRGQVFEILDRESAERLIAAGDVERIEDEKAIRSSEGVEKAVKRPSKRSAKSEG